MKSSRSDSIFSNSNSIKEYDSDLWASFEYEANRQEDHIELIASENYASKRINERYPDHSMYHTNRMLV